MTYDEFDQLLGNSIGTLQDNQNIATPQLIAEVEQITTKLSGMNLDPNIQTLVTDVGLVADMEKRLTESTPALIEILTVLRGHTVIMELLSRIL